MDPWVLCQFPRKNRKTTLRIIRRGEWMAKSGAKAVLRDNKMAILQLMVKLHQYGVAIPGGSETPFHGRSTIEDVARTGAM
eukprot:15037357-Heterocapsa_arctica.AAC.1